MRSSPRLPKEIMFPPSAFNTPIDPRILATIVAVQAGAVYLVAQAEPIFHMFKRVPELSPSLPGVPKLPTRALQADQQPQPRRAQHGRQDENLQGAARVLKACKMHARAMCWTHADLVAQANAFADVELHSDGRAPDSWQRGA